jgi:hypothetical protein
MLELSSSMKLSLLGDVGFVRLLRGIESSDVDLLTVHRDSGFVSILGESHAKNSNLVVLLSTLDVLHVGPLLYVAKVFKAIVRLVTIDVIDVVIRPSASDMAPDDAMDIVPLIAINGHLQVAVSTGCPNYVSGIRAIGGSDSTNQKPSLWRIVEKLAEAFCGGGRLNLAHAVVLLKRWFGKWSPTVSAAGLCAFYGLGAN